jgi:hypothetical protein
VVWDGTMLPCDVVQLLQPSTVSDSDLWYALLLLLPLLRALLCLQSAPR